MTHGNDRATTMMYAGIGGVAPRWPDPVTAPSLYGPRPKIERKKSPPLIVPRTIQESGRTRMS